MEAALLLILIITGNLALYWLFFGRKKFEEKFGAGKSEEKEASPWQKEQS